MSLRNRLFNLILMMIAAGFVVQATAAEKIPSQQEQQTQQQSSSQSNSKIEIIGYTLGDSHTSASSSQSFFQSMDSDRDGTVRVDELASFFKLSIGGANLDEETEIQREVHSVMNKLDQDHNNALDLQDLTGYWNHQLETLLTVDEVAEWVVYAIQLPHEIGHLFRINHVTGYDFPELVENDGLALETELGINKLSYRKRIVRLARAKMLGIGSLPDAPYSKNITVQVERCSAIAITWTKSEANGFPVHSYRIQRRTVGGSMERHTTSSSYHCWYSILHPEEKTCNKHPTHDLSSSSSSSHSQTTLGVHPPTSKLLDSDGVLYYSSSSSSSSPPPESSSLHEGLEDAPESISIQNAGSESSSSSHKHIPWVQTLSLSAPSEWKTLYVGAETQFVDTWIEKGKEYNYRVQAWSPIGRSSWTIVDITSVWKKAKCHIPPKISSSTPRGSATTHFCPKITNTLHAPADCKTATETTKSSMNNTDLHPSGEKYIKVDPLTSETFSAPWFFYYLFHSIGWIISFIVAFSRAFLAVTAFAAAAMKFRRMNLDTTTSFGEPIFPWLWTSVNCVSMKFLRKTIFPPYVTGEKKLKKKSSDLYDRQVNAMGLFGYKESVFDDTSNNHKLERKGKRKDISFNAKQRSLPSTNLISSHSKSLSTRGLSSNSLSIENEDLSRGNCDERFYLGSTESSGNQPLGRSQSSSILMNHPSNLNSQPILVDKATSTDLLQSTSSTVHAENFIHHRRRKWFSFASEGHKTITIVHPSMQDLQKLITMDEDRESSYSCQSLDLSVRDDFERCNTCQDVYKFPKRFRHHCSRCTATFCHKHGRITHSNLISCKVPGDCVCLPCLQKISIRSNGPS